jgi:hypothetical protein
MLDALNRANRYRELSTGCRRLAAIGLSAETRNHFLQMAEHYRTLAEAEESSKSAATSRRGWQQSPAN